MILLTSSANAVHASNREAEDDAFKKILTATYKQTGLEENINKLVERKLPKEYKDLAGQIAPLVQIIANHEVDYKWEF